MNNIIHIPTGRSGLRRGGKRGMNNEVIRNIPSPREKKSPKVQVHMLYLVHMCVCNTHSSVTLTLLYNTNTCSLCLSTKPTMVLETMSMIHAERHSEAEITVNDREIVDHVYADCHISHALGCVALLHTPHQQLKNRETNVLSTSMQHRKGCPRAERLCQSASERAQVSQHVPESLPCAFLSCMHGRSRSVDC